MSVRFYYIIILLISILFSCNNAKKTKTDDAFTFIGRNDYSIDNYNSISYYRLNGAKDFMDGYYVVANETTKWEEFNLKKGVLNGDYIIFHPNGEISSHTKYANGKRHGDELYYSNTGALIKKSTYNNAILIGKQYTYFENGKIQSQTILEHGSSVETQTYDVLGNIISQRFIKEGKTINQKIVEGKIYSEFVSSNYDDYETAKFFNLDGSIKLFLRQLKEGDTMYILELDENENETKRIDIKANPQEAMRYFSYFN